MSDKGDQPPAIGISGAESITAGAMLRAAREKRGLHIAALAASIKVSPRKLEALEADRYAELPDLTFTRALAQTMCRALRIDAAPVLTKLPQAGDMPKLSRVGGGINSPFKYAPDSRDAGEFTLFRKPAFWATLAVLIGAFALAFLPERWMPWRGAESGPPKARSASAAAAAAPSTVAAASIALPGNQGGGEPLATAAAAAPATESRPAAPLAMLAGSAPAAGAAASVLAVRTTAESWVEVQDGSGQTVLSRTVQPGESVGVDGALPLRLTIGNAAATQLVFRGRPVDLSANTHDNVARLQLP